MLLTHIIFFIIVIISYLSELTGTTKISHFIFSYSNCNNDYVRILFITALFLINVYVNIILYLRRNGAITKDNEHIWDVMGVGTISVNRNWIGPWHISHIITYMIYGFICPNDFVFATVLGVCFEILEVITDKIFWPKMIDNINTVGFWTTGSDGFNYKDIIANSIGYIIGACISKM